jgi:CRISPR-associated protein Csb2
MFSLPQAIPSHVRHGMPTATTKTRVLDAFVAVSRADPLLVHYPCELDAEAATLLERLVGCVSYLGRAESWVDMQMRDTVDIEAADWWRPGDSQDPAAQGIRLLAPLPPAAYREWREALAPELSTNNSPRGGTSIPADLLECLLMDTARLQQYGWNEPPGSRRVLYTQPPERSTIAAAAIPSGSPFRCSRSTVEAVVLALSPVAGKDGRCGVRPLVQRAVPQAELLHQSAVAMLGEGALSCPPLTGRDVNGKPLEGHCHAHYLPLDVDGDKRIDHVLVYAPEGLDERAQAALERISRTWTKGQVGDLLVRVVARGTLTEMREQILTRALRHLTILGTSRIWASLTPFVPPRHLKRTRHTLEDQIRDELRARGLPAPERVDELGAMEIVERRLFSFVTARREGKPQPAVRVSFGLRLTFSQPIVGPIAIGYGSHFGLGLFEAQEKPSAPQPAWTDRR